IDYELKLRRLLHGKVGGLRSFQYLVYVNSGAPEYFAEVGRIGHKTTILCVLGGRIHCRQPVFRRESDDFFAVNVGESVPDRDKSFGMLARCGSKSPLEIVGASHLE